MRKNSRNYEKCLFCGIHTTNKDWSGSGVYVCKTHN